MLSARTDVMLYLEHLSSLNNYLLKKTLTGVSYRDNYC